MFIFNRLGLIAWFLWVSRRKDPNQDSSARKYWSSHGKARDPRRTIRSYHSQVLAAYF